MLSMFRYSPLSAGTSPSVSAPTALSSSNMARRLAALFKALKMLAHLSGTLISRMVAEIISSQLNNMRWIVICLLLSVSDSCSMWRLPRSSGAGRASHNIQDNFSSWQEPHSLLITEGCYSHQWNECTAAVLCYITQCNLIVQQQNNMHVLRVRYRILEKAVNAQLISQNAKVSNKQTSVHWLILTKQSG